MNNMEQVNPNEAQSEVVANDPSEVVINVLDNGFSISKTRNEKKKEKTNNDDIWRHILNTINSSYNFKDDLKITSDQIKQAKGTWNGRDSQFEPRLLCKHDNIKAKPKIFSDNNLSLLSISNGVYILTSKKIFIKLPLNDKAVEKIDLKNISLLLTIGNSETSMLDKLQYSGIIDNIIGEKILLGPLLGGRHRCNFKTFIDNEEITINGSQYETDGCYETENYYVVVEVKNVDVEDFNIRQLYFPCKTIYDETKGNKQIISLFICKDKNDIIKIYKYKWKNINIMNDIECIDYYKYKFNNS